jgi:uncharacterized protein (DUF362 family)
MSSSPAPVGIRPPSSPQVAVVFAEGNLSAAVWREAKALNPDIFPQSLPARVVIKPNLCDIVAWENGVTTDPAWLQILACELRAIRPDVQIAVIESDAIGAYKTFRSCDETYERLGYTDAARNAGIDLINLSKAPSLDIRVPELPFPMTIPEIFLEEFFFISLANLKVHPYEHMTGILKNSLGLLPAADISHYHPYLASVICALHRLCPPDLAIIDGRIGLQGKGPIQGDPVSTNSIIFSNEAVAADLTACRLMTIAPQTVPHLRQTLKFLARGYEDFTVAGKLAPRKFTFDQQELHPEILAKFRNRRLHRESEIFLNRWISRFFRFKQEPIKFLTGAIPKLARRVYGSR